MTKPISPADFARVTGYELVDRDGDGQISEGDQVRVQAGEAAVALPAAALRQMYAAYARVRPDPARPATDPQAALRQINADLARGLFDGSPLTVTDAEARHAHDVLMAASPLAFNRVLGDLSAEALNRYITELAEAEPWSLTPGVSSPLVELATKMALELAPERRGRDGLIAKLDGPSRRRLQEAVLQLPNRALVERFADRVGREGFRRLVQGDVHGTVIGAALLRGQFWGDNAGETFKAHYAAQTGRSAPPAPPGIGDYVFLTGPGLLGDFLPGYLDVNERALRGWGVPAENIQRLLYDTVDSSAVNADRIFEQVSALHSQGKQIIVLGHSKFGADMKAAFARHPELEGMVAGAILMQPAPSAQIAYDLARPELAKVLAPALALTGGNAAAFTSMADPGLADQQWPGDKIPTVVFASSSEGPTELLRPLAKDYYDALYDTPSDGAVPLVDQTAFAGASVVVLPGAGDHARPGLTLFDACEHFARQIEAGVPDATVAGMLQRLAVNPQLAPLRWLADQLRRGFNTPEERAAWVHRLRQAGPVADAEAFRIAAAAGHPLIEPEAMTRALVATWFDERAARRR